ncbi:hypothetical protein BDV19DRAFT_171802 [Aspergillus venezuelensis]
MPSNDVPRDGETENKRFICLSPECTENKGYGRKGCLTRHIKTKHEAPRSQVCRVCQRRFDRADNLRSHCRRIHPEEE